MTKYIYIKKKYPHYELLEQLVERLKQFDAFQGLTVEYWATQGVN